MGGWVQILLPRSMAPPWFVKEEKHSLPLQQPPMNRTFSDKRQHWKIINSIFSFRTIPPTRPFLSTVMSSEGKKANKGSAEIIPHSLISAQNNNEKVSKFNLGDLNLYTRMNVTWLTRSCNRTKASSNSTIRLDCDALLSWKKEMGNKKKIKIRKRCKFWNKLN